MRNKNVQISLLDIYHSVEECLENNKPELFNLLDEHLDWDEIIPNTFYNAFYQRLGRNREYELESFMRALFLQRIFRYVEDTQLENFLRHIYKFIAGNPRVMFSQVYCYHNCLQFNFCGKREKSNWSAAGIGNGGGYPLLAKLARSGKACLKNSAKKSADNARYSLIYIHLMESYSANISSFSQVYFNIIAVSCQDDCSFSPRKKQPDLIRLLCETIIYTAIR